MEMRRRSVQSFAETVSQCSSERRDYDYGAEKWSDWRPRGARWNYNSMYPYNPKTSSCHDYVGRYDGDNELAIGHEAIRLGQLQCGSDYEYVSQQSYPIRFQSRTKATLPIIPQHVMPSNDELSRQRVEFATRAAAGVNPSRPVVDLAVFIGELRDLPSLFENTGRSLLKFGGNRYLQHQYGWKPLVKDLRSFMKVVNSVDRRLRAIERLNKEKALKLPFKSQQGPEIQLGTDSTLSDKQAIMPGCRAILQHSTLWSTRRWATVHFKAEVPSNLVTLPGRSNLAMANKALYGGTVDGATLWQLMPWSWLADWTSNVGEFLSSQRNIVGAKVTSVTVMELMTQSSGTVLQGWDLDDGIPTPYSNFLNGSLETVLKLRFPEIIPAVVSAGEVDILHSTFKTSILTALAIQRLRFL